MSETLEHLRTRCRKRARDFLEVRKTCHIDPGRHSDGCGYYRGKFCYLRVDCRVIRGKPLCRISIVDHYSGEVLFSEACRAAPKAGR